MLSQVISSVVSKFGIIFMKKAGFFNGSAFLFKMISIIGETSEKY